MDKMERIAKQLEELLLRDKDAMLNCVRELNSWNGCLDWLEFYENDEEFFEMFFEDRTMELLRAMKYGNFNFDDDYIKFDGYGNLETYSYREMIEEVESCIEEIVENLIENRDEIDVRWIDTEIADLLEELDEEDEEE